LFLFDKLSVIAERSCFIADPGKPAFSRGDSELKAQLKGAFKDHGGTIQALQIALRDHTINLLVGRITEPEEKLRKSRFAAKPTSFPACSAFTRQEKQDLQDWISNCSCSSKLLVAN